MKKRSVTFHILEIPFKGKFAHHTAVREKSETVITILTNESGDVGYGESCPRHYVTGETLESAQAFLTNIASIAPAIQSFEDLKKTVQHKAHEIDVHPSAWCAFELACLDLLAKEKKVSVEQMLGLESKQIFNQYTAVLGIDRPLRSLTKLFAYLCFGFKDFKIKLSGNQRRDLKIIKFVNMFSRKIRVDGNNIFKSSDEAIVYLKPFCPYIWAVEEPIAVKDFKGHIHIAETLKIKIILDESFLTEDDFEQIKSSAGYFVPNLRISKQGGLLRTLNLISKLEAANAQWILGSHVGEMSLLTRASLVIAAQKFKGLIAKEGGFSTHLLQYDPFLPNIKIQSGAKIELIPTEPDTGFNLKYEQEQKK